MRSLTLALILAAASFSAPSFAQDEEVQALAAPQAAVPERTMRSMGDGERGMRAQRGVGVVERAFDMDRGDFGGRARIVPESQPMMPPAIATPLPVPSQAQQPAQNWGGRRGDGNGGGGHGGRGHGGGWQQPSSQPAPQAVPQAMPQSSGGGERNWGGRGGNGGGWQQPQSGSAPSAQPQSRNWGGGGRRHGGWQQQPQAMPAPAQPQPQGGNWRGGRGGGGWQQPAPNNGGSPSMDHGGRRHGGGDRWGGHRDGPRVAPPIGQPPVAQGRNWGRHEDGRRIDGNRHRNRGWNHGGGWNGRGSHDSRGYRHNNRRDDNWGSNHRNWNRGWRDNHSYDWRGHRNQYRHYYQQPRYYNPYGFGYSRFSIGFFLDNLFYSERYWISDPWQYRLPAAYGSYRWVRYYDDVILVDLRSGEVVDVIHNFFW